MSSSGPRVNAGSREYVISACAVIVLKARRRGTTMLARSEAARLFAANPTCGMTEREIVDLLVRLAGQNFVPVDSEM